MKPSWDSFDWLLTAPVSELETAHAAIGHALKLRRPATPVTPGAASVPRNDFRHLAEPFGAGSSSRARGGQKRDTSIRAMAAKVLRDAGKPMLIEQIATMITRAGGTFTQDSVRSSLYRSAAAGDTVMRTLAGTFGLIEWKPAPADDQPADAGQH